MSSWQDITLVSWTSLFVHFSFHTRKFWNINFEWLTFFINNVTCMSLSRYKCTINVPWYGYLPVPSLPMNHKELRSSAGQGLGELFVWHLVWIEYWSPKCCWTHWRKTIHVCKFKFCTVSPVSRLTQYWVSQSWVLKIDCLNGRRCCTWLEHSKPSVLRFKCYDFYALQNKIAVTKASYITHLKIVIKLWRRSAAWQLCTHII